MSINYTTKTVTTTPYTLSNSDEIIFINVAGLATVVLPLLPSNECGRAYYIKDYSGNAKKNPITITATGKTIDGVTFAMLNQGYSHIQVVYDGTNWLTIS